MYAVPRALRPDYEPIPLGSAVLSSSGDPGGWARWWTGAWTPRGARPGRSRPATGSPVDLGTAVTVARIDLLLGDDPRFSARELRVLVSEDGASFREAPRCRDARTTSGPACGSPARCSC